MLTRHWVRNVSLVAAALGLVACAETPTGTAPGIMADVASAGGAKSYILLSAGSSLPSDLAASVAAIGGTLVSTTPQIGMAVATSTNPSFAAKAAKLRGIGQAGEDPMVQWVDPSAPVMLAGVDSGGPVAQANPVGSTETFRLVQWAPDAVNAPAAWAAGQLGAGARVAILDGGIDATQPDLAPNFDVAHSASFVPGFAFNQDVGGNGTFWHAMHVAGIVAAADNGFGTIGIAPEATLVGVKVLHGGSGQFSWLIEGIVYASTPIADGGAGADIINMSLGGTFLKQGPAAAHLTNAITRAADYATQHGALLVAAAGNSALDFDHTANVVFYPAQAANVVAVSATGPLGWAVPGNPFDLDRPASYTNYGQSAITFAGPGGDDVYEPVGDVCSKPRLPSGFLVAPCWAFDLVMSPGSPGTPYVYFWADGTSMAAPAVSGVAALVVGKYGHMRPQQLRQILQRSADDLGKPGNDDFYGGGRVNAGRAVQ
jgi:subtilisin family serine protease